MLSNVVVCSQFRLRLHGSRATGVNIADPAVISSAASGVLSDEGSRLIEVT